jgi:hypothetical protein
MIEEVPNALPFNLHFFFAGAMLSITKTISKPQIWNALR